MKMLNCIVLSASLRKFITLLLKNGDSKATSNYFVL